MLIPIIIATLSSIYDGDTIFVDIAGVHPIFGQRIGVRLKGIDAAERASLNKCEKWRALAATQYLESQLIGQTILELSNCTRDKYFRLDCEIFIKGKSVAQQVLKNSYAVPFDGVNRTKTNWCSFQLGGQK